MDPITEIFMFIVILGFGTGIRYIPHARFYFPSTSDTFFFFNKIRNADYKSKEVDYPKFFDSMIRAFLSDTENIPEMTLNRLSPIFDIISSCLMYFFVRTQFNDEIALFSMLLFLLTPIVAKQGASLSVRPFGLLLFSTSLLFLTLPFPLNWLAAIPMALTLLAHRLSAQTLYFTSFALSLLDIQIGLIMLMGFFLAIILSKGEYVRILRNHVLAVRKYMKGDHYPNQRIKGLLLIPSFLGFLAYFSVFILQKIEMLPIELLGFEIVEFISYNLYSETILIVWGLVCLLLLLLWLAGESYKHLYLASFPFAILSSLIRSSGYIFEIAYWTLVVASISLSLYFLARHEHIEREFVETVSILRKIESEVLFLAPSGYDRAAEYYSEKKGAPVYFIYVTKEELHSRVNAENVTHMIIQSTYKNWFDSWNVVVNVGQWYVLERPIT